MKNITSREDFLSIKEQQMNEGIISAIKGMFKGIKKMYAKIKGGKELNAKIEEYKEKINKIFSQMTTAEQTKTAITKNVEAAVESKLYELETAEVVGSEEAQTPKNTEEPNTDNENDKATPNKEQVTNKINIAKDHIKQLQKAFGNEVEALKKKFADKEGNIPKKLDISLSLARNQLTDYIYQKWEEHFDQIGNKKAIQNIQKQRAEVAKEMKTNTEALKRLIEGGDKEKVKFEVGKKYKYTNSEGKVIAITVKEVDENGDVTKAETRKGNEINPYTENIGEYYEVGQTYDYTGKQGETTVTILKVTPEGKYQVKSKGGQTFMAPAEKLGYKAEIQKEKTQ